MKIQHIRTLPEIVRSCLQAPKRSSLMQPVSQKTVRNLTGASFSFGTTIDLRKDPANPADGPVVDGITSSRNFLQNSPGLVRREIFGWDILGQEKTTSAFYLPDAQTTFHIKKFSQESQSVEDSLADESVADLLANPGSKIYSFLRNHLGLAIISLHLGYPCNVMTWHPTKGYLIPASEILPEATVLEKIVQSLNHFERNVRALGYHGPLLIENNDYHQENGLSAYKYVTDADFIGAVLARTNFGFLLDLGHLLVSAKNKKTDPFDHLEQILNLLNIHKIQEVHLSVPQKGEDEYLDRHRTFSHNPESEEAQTVMQLLGHLLLFRKKHFSHLPLTINFELREPGTEATLAQDFRIIVEFIERVLALSSC